MKINSTAIFGRARQHARGALFPRVFPRQNRCHIDHFTAPSKLGPIRTGPGKMISNRFEYFQIDVFYTLLEGAHARKII